MRTIHYILYHMHIFKSAGVCGSKPAPTPIPENEVIEFFFFNAVSEQYYSEIFLLIVFFLLYITIL